MRIYWVDPVKNIFKLCIAIMVLVALGFYIVSGVHWNNHWDQIIQRGHLNVAVRESEGIYWPNGQFFSGFEHDLLMELQQHLDIPIQIFAVRDMDDLYHALEVGAVDMALPATSMDYLNIPQSLPYATTQIGLVKMAKTESDSARARIGILDPLAHHDAVTEVMKEYPGSAAIYEHGRLSAELFTLINLQELERVLVDERDFRLQQNAFPNLSFTALDFPERALSILFPPGKDDSLLLKVNDILTIFNDSGLLGRMVDRYLGEALEFDYSDNLTFAKHMKARLPRYQALFQKYAEAYHLDWRLLAAIGYQESHWRAKATSPTGVRGMMMITRSTAAEVGITNRLDPEQSIKAGAQYFTSLKSRVPARITEPDRSWLALAAYNVGAGHVEDARKITQILGDNPDIWVDVRKHLPKLALKDYYPWTKHGYARGSEPVVYVANIRRFYEKLKTAYPEPDQNAEPDRLEQLPEANVPVFPGQF